MVDDDEAEKTEPSPGYGNGPGYWNSRYQEDPEPFEWLESFADLQAMLEEISGGRKTIRVLHVGCGNSCLTERMYDDGYEEIVNIDNSAVVIEQMRTRNAGRPGMSWLEMDATNMAAFPDRSFDLVVDKSVLDTFACTDNALVTVATYLKEVTRCLKHGGTYLCVSYGAPSTRLNFLELGHLEWSLRQVELPAQYEASNPHYAYILKTPDEPKGARESYEEVLKKQRLGGRADRRDRTGSSGVWDAQAR
eukprot:CAMPEP_0171240980 /NCGR_PEP_ID=MMETSP0790-20130122/44831_1 /TAXON_ID=2925 /ORGANISM="Alexandrium catenella, Strain OF101" /LENGTH=248 /DNA_ID=CAMNT_0011707519 /DNA_START=30 /DNA_END=773 /DNA_ORIENTATION=+